MSFFSAYQQHTPVVLEATPREKFFQAIERGDVAEVKKLISQVDKDAVDDRGNTAGIVALLQHMEAYPPQCDKYTQILHVLGENKFDFSKPNKGGWTMLYIYYQNRKSITPEVGDYIKKVLGDVPISYPKP
jgi:hypothetical protein